MSSAATNTNPLNDAAADPPVSRPAVIDRFGRTLRYMRVSVTDVCNLSCQYCNPVKACGGLHPHKLSWDDLEFLVDVSARDLGVEAIRITGGEPTVRPGLVDWVTRIATIPGIVDIAITTNGLLLERLAAPLREAGVGRVNVSVDTFDAEKFREITRGGQLDRVLRGIELSRQLFNRVKLNAVLLKGSTLAEMERFVAFSHENEIEVRFIELMPIFDQKEYFEANFLSVGEAIAHLESLGHELEAEGDGGAAGNRTGYGPATTFRVVGSRARIGFISQMSDTKCLHCNKLRLTSDGALKPCLLAPEEIDLTDAIKSRDRITIARHARRQFLERAERYDYLAATTQSLGRGMQATGG